MKKGKTALLISESSVYTNEKGEFMCKGGGEGSFHKLGKALVDLGVQVKVFAIREFVDQKASEFIDGVEYVRFPVRSKTSFGIFKYLMAARDEARGVDYVFVNQFSPHLVLPFLSRRGAKVSCKKIAVIHDVYKGKGIGFWIKQFGFFAGIIGSVIERFQLWADKKYADVILTVSEESKRRVEKAFGRVRKKIIVVQWPVFSEKKEVSLKEKKDLILFVGRFVEYKNPTHVLYVLKEIKKKYPRFQALLVASRIDKKLMEEFDDLRRKLGLTAKDVVVEENVSYEKLEKYYRAAKMLIHPSFVEGQGMVLPEALSYGTPVVAYDLEAYEQFRNSRLNLVPLRMGYEGLSETCLKVLRNYNNYRASFSNKGSDDSKTFKNIIASI